MADYKVDVELQMKIANAKKQIQEVTQKIRETVKGGANVKNQLNKAGNNKLKKSVEQINKEVKKMSSALKNVTSKGVTNLENSFKRMIPNLKRILPMITALVSALAIKDVVNQSVDREESTSLFMMAFGNNAAKAKESIDNLTNSLQLNSTEVIKGAGTLRVLVGNMAKTKEEADSMALALTERAADMSSFYNIDLEQVLENLQSGMSGQAMAMRKYGVDITGASSSQERFNKIMQQTQVSAGDLVRTQDSLSNILRRMSSAFNNLKTAIGDTIAPLAKTILPMITQFIQRLTVAFQFAAQVMNSLFGVKTQINATGAGVSALGDSLDYVADTANDAAKAVAKLASFDEINVISENDKGTESQQGVGFDLGFNSQDDAIGEIPAKVQEMVDKVKGILAKLKEDFNLLRNGFENIGEGFRKAFDIEIFKNIIAKVGELKDTFLKLINSENARIFGEIGGHLGNIAGLVFGAIIDFINKLLGFIATSELFKDLLLTIKGILKAIESIAPAIKLAFDIVVFVILNTLESVWVALKGLFTFVFVDIPKAFKYMAVIIGIVLRDIGILIVNLVLAPFKLILWGIEKITGKSFGIDYGFWNPVATKGMEIPAMATGGIVNKSTLALVGEGKYPEAVVPLNDSSFAKLAEGITNAGGTGGGDNQPLVVQCVFDGRIVSETVINNINSKARITGKSPILV